MLYAHRVAYVEANGLKIEDIDGLVVRHLCDNPPCINPNHLELGTQADNLRDMVDRGRQVRGEDSGRAILTAEQVAEIRDRYIPYCRANGARALSRELGVHNTTVSAIVNGENWKHIIACAENSGGRVCYA